MSDAMVEAEKACAEKLIPLALRDMRDNTSGEQLRVLTYAIRTAYLQGRIDEVRERIRQRQQCEEQPAIAAAVVGVA